MNRAGVVFAAILGSILGVVLWTALAMCLLLLYWVGYEFVFLGVLCGGGKFGLRLFDPPAAAVEQTSRECALYFTVFAFTWGEVMAAVLGAALGAVGGFGGMRILSLVLRRFRRGGPAEQEGPVSTPPSGSLPGPPPSPPADSL